MILDAGRTTFRNEIYDKYKANRPEPPEDLIPQFPLIREAAKAFNVPVCELEGFEADDLIATYARLAVEAGGTCTIVSSDKDLMQLIRPGRRDVRPDQEEAARARRGDGEVRRHARTRSSTCRRWPAIRPTTCRACRASASRPPPSCSASTATSRRCWPAPARSSSPSGAKRCRATPSWRASPSELVQLRDDVPTPAEPDAFDKRQPDPNVLLPWLEQQGFKSLVAKYARSWARRPARWRLRRPRRRRDARAPSAGAGRRAKSNRPSPPTDYEPIRTEAALDEWIAEATKAGVVALRLETDGSIQAGWSACRSPCSTGRGATSIPAAGARPTCRSAIARRAARRRARSISAAPAARRRRQAAARPAPAPDRDREAEAAARGPGRAQGRPEHQVRHERASSSHGITIAPVDDTMLLSFVLDGGKHGHGMDELAERYLGQKTDQVLRRRRLAAPSR